MHRSLQAPSIGSARGPQEDADTARGPQEDADTAQFTLARLQHAPTDLRAQSVRSAQERTECAEGAMGAECAEEAATPCARVHER